MRVIVSVEARLIKTQNGSHYGKGPIRYDFLRRYLEVFDDVIVLARVEELAKEKCEEFPRADGPNITVKPVPCFVGLKQFLRQYRKANFVVRQSIELADAYMLRAPGIISTLLWRQLINRNIPYGIEVVGDPWDVHAPGTVKSVFRPIIRRKMRKDLIRQCRCAAAATYVTQVQLQRRYPPGGWSTYYSDVELPPDAIADEYAIKKRIKKIESRIRNEEPWCICHVGTLAQLYKAPDVLIEAVSNCISEGIQLELIMVGEGQYRSQLESQARNLGIWEHVRFLGKVPVGKAVFEQLDRADMFILPSRTEGLPRSVIEAMARGLPCITSNVGGLPELMEPQYMVSPGDAKALTRKIIWLISHPELIEPAIRRNVKASHEYRPDILQKRRIEFYRKTRQVSDEWRSGKG